MNELEILRKFMIEFEDDFIPSISFDSEQGYKTNFRSSEKASYAKRIGAEFIKYNIPFASLYDIGHGKYDSAVDDSEVQKSYIESCKQTPNQNFLKNILPFNEQKNILLKVLNKIDLKLLFDNPIGEKRFTNEDLNKLNFFFNMIDDLKNAGLDKLHINNELTTLIESHYNRGEVTNHNIAISFIYNNFAFSEEFMNTTFKKAFFTHLTTSQQHIYDSLCCANNKNSIKCSYYDLNNELPPKEEKNTKKNKI